jgi:L-ascorbate metabolism protein UlaG (beta-lactamase superfamily)
MYFGGNMGKPHGGWMGSLRRSERWLNLGDTMFLEEAWQGLHLDVLMIPIGGMMTMDVDSASQATKVIEPGMVIQMHYNWDILLLHRPVNIERSAKGGEL